VLFTTDVDDTSDNILMVSLKAVADLTLHRSHCKSQERYYLATCVVDTGDEFATGVAALLWLVSTPTSTVLRALELLSQLSQNIK
jgi:hypothetical protein